MQCASAGHPGPLIWTRGAVEDPITQRTLPLGFGMLSHAPVDTFNLRLEPGCTVVFFTDGLIEWERKPLNGQAALIHALQDPAVRNARNPARAIRDACIHGAHGDDIAVLVMRYERNE